MLLSLALQDGFLLLWVFCFRNYCCDVADHLMAFWEVVCNPNFVHRPNEQTCWKSCSECAALFDVIKLRREKLRIQVRAILYQTN